LFEIFSSDLLGRNGLIITSKGDIRTPCFVPVVHPEPRKNLINVQEFKTKYDVDLIITSSYILRNRFNEEPLNLHELTGFLGPIMTDSGAYQSLVYGEVEITPESTISFQESIKSDFGVPLDIPIAINDSYEVAENKVNITLERCRKISELVKKSDIIWIGPIQGGKYLDLIEKSAKVITKISTFNMYAIGGVVELMSNYRYDTVIEMIIRAKQFLDPAKPVHLFGAGHPSMFPLIVAAGCDSFDSASYSLYAQDDRYITNTQTFQLSELEEFPCNCPVCLNISPQELLQLSKNDRMKLLASHNLYICQTEIKNIRRAISAGTLWELLEARCLAHPKLKDGFDILCKYKDFLETNTPSTKRKGIFIISNNSYYRPEVQAHIKKIETVPIKKHNKLLLISLINSQVEESYNLFRNLKSYFDKISLQEHEFDIWILDPVFRIFPLEISEVYPLAQYINTKFSSMKMIRQNIEKSLSYVNSCYFTEILILGELDFINEIMINKRIFNQGKIKAINISIERTNFDRIISFINKMG